MWALNGLGDVSSGQWEISQLQLTSLTTVSNLSIRSQASYDRVPFAPRGSTERARPLRPAGRAAVLPIFPHTISLAQPEGSFLLDANHYMVGPHMESLHDLPTNENARQIRNRKRAAAVIATQAARGGTVPPPSGPADKRLLPKPSRRGESWHGHQAKVSRASGFRVRRSQRRKPAPPYPRPIILSAGAPNDS